MIVKQYIGVDMAKHTFDACFADDKPVKTYPNTISGIKNLFRTIEAKKDTPLSGITDKNIQVNIGVESTSHYHMLLCMREKEKGYIPILINPLITNKYSQRNIRKTKTDKIDARIIRYCTIQNEGYPWQETAETLTLKHLVRERDYLANLKNVLLLRKDSIDSKSLAAGQVLPTVNTDIYAYVEQKMKQMEKELRQYKKLEQKLLQILPAN